MINPKLLLLLNEIVGEPPNPLEVDAALSGLCCGVGTMEVTYMSMPITTGKRFFSWYRAVGHSIDPEAYSAAHQNAVVRPNLLISEEKLAELRSQWVHVVSPGDFQVMQWTQSDYLWLWLRFIAKRAARVVASDGWEYSSGCALEVACAQVVGVPVLDASLQVLPPERSLELVERAFEELSAEGLRMDGVAGAMSVLQQRRSLR